MSWPRVRTVDDPTTALSVAGAFLTSRPVEHNLLLTILHDRVARPEPGRYWIVSDDGAVVGFALQSPRTFSAVVAPLELRELEALVDAMAADTPELPGVTADAATAAPFAGRWAERLGVPATPVEGGRIYRLELLAAPERVRGALRRAVAMDTDELVRWARRFHTETRATAGDPVASLGHALDEGRLFVWEDTRPASMALATRPVAGVSRIGLVYTPPQCRRRGYAAACVAALSARTLAAGASACILYTQLGNPTSNGVYRRIGYRAVGEVLSYRFGRAGHDGPDPRPIA